MLEPDCCGGAAFAVEIETTPTNIGIRISIFFTRTPLFRARWRRSATDTVVIRPVVSKMTPCACQSPSPAVGKIELNFAIVARRGHVSGQSTSRIRFATLAGVEPPIFVGQKRSQDPQRPTGGAKAAELATTEREFIQP